MAGLEHRGQLSMIVSNLKSSVVLSLVDRLITFVLCYNVVSLLHGLYALVWEARLMHLPFRKPPVSFFIEVGSHQIKPPAPGPVLLIGTNNLVAGQD